MRNPPLKMLVLCGSLPSFKKSPKLYKVKKVQLAARG